MSAEVCLAGLFPPIGDQIWNNDLKWQPIPVHAIPDSQRYVLEPHRQCDRYDALNAYIEQQLFDGLVKKYDPIVRYLEENTGEKLTSLYQVQKLYDTLSIQRSKDYRCIKQQRNQS